MRDSGGNYYSDSHKSHLSRLPTLTMESPRIENPSKRLLVLIPLIRFGKGVYVKEAGMIGAIWARHSWLMNTDAVEHGIEMKFYIEDVLKEVVMPILEANAIDMDTVIFFNATQFENDNFPRLHGKVAASYVDPRFREYDWLFVMDCDMFAMSPSQEKVLFFEKFFAGCVEGVIGSHYARVRGIGVPINWVEHLGDDSVSFDDKQVLWREQAETIVSAEVAGRFWDENVESIIPGVSMHAYPAKIMMQDDSRIEWFRHTAQVMQEGDAIIALYHALGNPVWNIREHLKFNDVMVGPNIVGSHYDRFKAFVNAGEPFILHYSMNPVECFWREWIGALE